MPLNANALTTLAFAKTYLKIPSTETSQDALVEFFINAASQDVESETNRKLKAQSHTEYQHGRKSNTLLLREFPINSVTELRIDSTSNFTDAQTLMDTDDYRIADDKNALVLLNGVFPNGYQNIRAIYNAGYTTVPSDLEHACLWLVFYYHKMRIAEDIGRSSKSKGDESMSMLQEAPANVRNTIQRYKRTEFEGPHALIFNG